MMIAYGNGIMTRYAYDQQTFRLSRLRTERFTHPNGDRLIFEPNGDPLQDFTYTYDLAGNITSIEERVPHCGFTPNPDAVFVSDPTLRGSVAAGDALVRSLESIDLSSDCLPQAAPAGIHLAARSGRRIRAAVFI